MRTLRYQSSVLLLIVLLGGFSYHLVTATAQHVPDTFSYSPSHKVVTYAAIASLPHVEGDVVLPFRMEVSTTSRGAEDVVVSNGERSVTRGNSAVFTVPFYSQFTDISSPEWRTVGCGIASLAMVIEFYKPGSVSVDTLLEEGIAADAFLTNAGWIHAGLIGLAKKNGLSGTANSVSHLSTEAAFAELTAILNERPVIASVHYTFDPANPIPHLVVVNGVHDGKVYYNDPSESAGGGSIPIAKFQSSWKKRYIELHPVS